MKQPLISLLSALLVLSFSTQAQSGPQPAVPDVLRPWVSWVAERHPELACPFQYDQYSQRDCTWPGRLQLEVQSKQALFRQEWTLYQEARVALPGGEGQWPDEVQVDGQRWTVLDANRQPAILLKPGQHVVTGQLRWQRRPDHIQLPHGTGLVSLELDGKTVQQPVLDAQDRLWLGRSSSQAVKAQPGQDTQTIRVYRRLVDDIPMQLETVLDLAVSGQDRELQLGRLLLDGFTPMQLQSPLPARIENDGQLRVQVRPGNWQIRMIARADAQPTAFGIDPQPGLWPGEEIWSFAARHELRNVELTGVAGIDPQRTGMPEAWKQLPAYLMQVDSALQLTEQQRGDPSPAPDQLKLQRSLWLDSDGGGYTIEDRIEGQFNRPRRLAMQPGYDLGRAELNGQPQLVTRLGDGDEAGLEIPPGVHQLVAVSRFSRSAGVPGASGWQAEFQQVKASLRLPPGWMLLGADGVDQARPSWISRWSLWDVFLVLIVGATFARLYTLPIGLLAFFAVVAAYHVPDAPVVIWLNLAAVLALLKLVPESRVRRLLLLWRNLSFVALILILLPFAVSEVRQGIYPQLEKPWQVVNTQAVAKPATQAPEREIASEPAMATMDTLEKGAAQRKLLARSAPSDYGRPVAERYQAGAMIQTGPGLPTWTWNQARLSWNGPVTEQDRLQLHLLGPLPSRLLHFLRVILFALLVYMLLRESFQQAGRWRFTPSAAGLLLPLAVLAGSLAPEPAHADFPPAELLQELEQRLLEAPTCVPACASLQQAEIQVRDDALRILLRIHTAEALALPLPLQREQWQPQAIQLRAQGSIRLQPVTLRRNRDGRVFIALHPGQHELLLQGSLQGMEQLGLVFPLRPQAVSIEARGWQVSGLADGRLQGDALQLQRKASRPPVPDQTQPTLRQGPFPAFVQVERHLQLGEDWQLTTIVRRLAPVSGAITLQVPLLHGESVTTAGTRVSDGMVSVSIGARQQAISWTSLLEKSPEVRLVAAETGTWTETWHLRHDSRWHVENAGIAPIKRPASQLGAQTWRPWPGESITLAIHQPEAVPGPTRTLESVRLRHQPGQRAASSSLQLRMRASQGGEFEFALPAGAVLQNVVINGAEQALPQAKERVRVPLTPGMQDLEIAWQTGGETALRTPTPALDLGLPLSNVDLELQMPRDRWLLFTGGPAIGPAVLYWGVLAIIVLVALALGRAGQLPLKTWHWLLLGAGMMTTDTIPMALFVVAWFFALQRRSQLDVEIPPSYFNLMQAGLGALTLLAVGALVASVPAGLLGTPDMQIVGNGSGGTTLRWYQDHADQQLPTGWVISLPIWTYRLAMLGWSLWLAFALLGWLRWGWGCFSKGGLWRKRTVVASEQGASQHVAVEAVKDAPDPAAPQETGD